ncbi:endonuclease [Myroides phaeus]|uniref:endonuclease I family protein n=1 Tax=Myroides phaeus TaxID=702745 RepID=UPI002DBF84D1|nr:endonuclease [Myroides phaeus]MEC4117082.1 endonuclease [Myroides phaeus]
MNKYTFVAIATFFVAFTSCKKNAEAPTPIIEANQGFNPIVDTNHKANLVIADKYEKEYYSNIDLTKTGESLKNDLHDLLVKTHKQLQYTPDIWEACKVTDADPANKNNLILMYSWPATEAKLPKHRPAMSKYDQNNRNVNADRDKKWEREHIFAKSLAKPKLVTREDDYAFTQEGLIAGVDAHNLRAINGEWNEERGNKRFTQGSGNAGVVTVGREPAWYPGDEWKGDVARMVMYMYVRYGKQCAPNLVGTGAFENNTQGGSDKMLKLFLQWNAEDPVSDIERKRNEYHGNPTKRHAQGNRNPFIDNPYLATAIWGGPQAENKWQ